MPAKYCGHLIVIWLGLGLYESAIAESFNRLLILVLRYILSILIDNINKVIER